MAAPTGVYQAMSLASNGNSTPFKLVPRDTRYGGLLRLFATWAAVGTWDGATVQLQVFLVGTWLPFGAGLTANGIEILSNANSPYGPKFRFSITGGGGSEVLSVEIASYANFEPTE